MLMVTDLLLELSRSIMSEEQQGSCAGKAYRDVRDHVATPTFTPATPSRLVALEVESTSPVCKIFWILERFSHDIRIFTLDSKPVDLHLCTTKCKAIKTIETLQQVDPRKMGDLFLSGSQRQPPNMQRPSYPGRLRQSLLTDLHVHEIDLICSGSWIERGV